MPGSSSCLPHPSLLPNSGGRRGRPGALAPLAVRAARDCPICILQGRGVYQHFYEGCPGLKGLAPEAISALKKEARAKGHDAWWNELQAKNEAKKTTGDGAGGRSRDGKGARRSRGTALALSETKELTDTIRGLLALTPPPSPPPSGDMDALDDVRGSTGARVERGRGSVHNGVADQALANPDMSIAELLFESPRLLLWRLAVWCAALPWRAAYVAACAARATCRAARRLYDRGHAATPPLVDRNDEFADRLAKLLPPERFTELRDGVLTDNTAALRVVEQTAERDGASHVLREGVAIRELVEREFHQPGDRCVGIGALTLDHGAPGGRRGAPTTTPAAVLPLSCSAPPTSRRVLPAPRASPQVPLPTSLAGSRGAPTSSRASPPALRWVPPSRLPSRPRGLTASALPISPSSFGSPSLASMDASRLPAPCFLIVAINRRVRHACSMPHQEGHLPPFSMLVTRLRRGGGRLNHTCPSIHTLPVLPGLESARVLVPVFSARRAPPAVLIRAFFVL